ncbi:MAG: 2-iminoacetate synthase ThiH [Firmicutes bacterium]|nr:2-iminoacetate synthase ThiH [Bacillota bacterium]
MSFYDIYLKYKKFKYEEFFKGLTRNDILRVLNRNKMDDLDFLTLLSPLAGEFLEDMAIKANKLSLQHFGKAILLFTPMYIANHCVNKCTYCGFNIDNDIRRKKLSMDEIEKEAKYISKKGLKHILILTGESKRDTPVSYIVDAIKVLKKYFNSISIEIYPLTEDEYRQVINTGVDGLTIYQEVYDERIYDKVHLAGPKKNYRFRLDAPERACKGNIRSVNIGALLGLNKWRKEAFMSGLHANYLQNKYPDTEISISPPRIRPHVGIFDDVYDVNDRSLVQYILALRLYMPYLGITISTREDKYLRDNLIPLGITKMSAGVTTEVGGHTQSNKSDSQFEISDKRSVKEIREIIISKGYQPVFKNWMDIGVK